MLYHDHICLYLQYTGMNSVPFCQYKKENLENLYKYSSRSICSILIGEQNWNHFCPCSVCAVNSLPKKAFSLKEIVLSSDYPYADSLPTVISISKAMCTCTLYPKVVAKSYPKSVSFLPTIFFRRETGCRK